MSARGTEFKTKARYLACLRRRNKINNNNLEIAKASFVSVCFSIFSIFSIFWIKFNHVLLKNSCTLTTSLYRNNFGSNKIFNGIFGSCFAGKSIMAAGSHSNTNYFFQNLKSIISSLEWVAYAHGIFISLKFTAHGNISHAHHPREARRATERSEGVEQLGCGGGAVSPPHPPMGSRDEAQEIFEFLVS